MSEITTTTIQNQEGGGEEGKRREGEGVRVRKRRTLSVSEEVYQRLMKHGQYRDTISNIINRCIESHEKILGKGE